MTTAHVTLYWGHGAPRQRHPAHVNSTGSADRLLRDLAAYNPVPQTISLPHDKPHLFTTPRSADYANVPNETRVGVWFIDKEINLAIYLM
jgi:hypothetical protein